MSEGDSPIDIPKMRDSQFRKLSANFRKFKVFIWYKCRCRRTTLMGQVYGLKIDLIGKWMTRNFLKWIHNLS